MLRHYQEHGILEPALIDSFTGHRYYSPDQLLEAHWVVRLRDAGLPVASIGQIVAHRDDANLVHEIMDAHRERLRADRTRLESMTSALERIRFYLEESDMEINVRTVRMPSMTVAALRRVLPSYGNEGDLWQEIGGLMARSGAAMPAHDEGVGGATFYDPDYRESDVDVEVWLQVSEPFIPVAPLICKDVPERDVVTATLLGSYDGMHQISTAIGAYIAENALQTGPMFNIYRVSPVQNPDPAAWVTDVCFPIEPGD